MGHFGILPIRIGWFALVFPCLILNYLGQGAFVLNALEAATAAGKPLADQDWFFLMAPDALRPWLIVLAMLATVIASQAVITGAFSLTQQAIQLGLLPRLAHPQHLGGASGADLPAVDQLAVAGRRAGTGGSVPYLGRDGGCLWHRSNGNDGGDDMPRLHRSATSLELGPPAGARP